MTTTTFVVWGKGLPVQADADEIAGYVSTLVANGDTDGVSTNAPGVVADTYSVQRTWIDTNAADAWVTYITAFNPVSAEVIIS